MADKTARKSKSFRVAVEGATATDGRTIEKSWIQDIAAGYNRETYGARVNLEHIHGYTPNGDFKAYGDVLAVHAEEVSIELNGKAEKRLALFAEIEPTDELVAMTQAKQKIYTSIEVAPNFAGTGKAGLVGLAVTDTPASLATEILSFSAKPEFAAFKTMLDGRKTDPANHFSAALETSIEFEEPAAPTESALEKFAGLLIAKLTGSDKPATEPVVQQQLTQEKTAPADGTAAMAGMFKDLTEALAADRKADAAAAETRFKTLETTITSLKSDLEKTPKGGQPTRQLSSGGDSTARIQVDC
ncbi:MAG: GPO family capsid scaffolding protein [Brevundimonas sp.]|uniref:GPO family capsid scaffolding protein n=1 Tax=Brevundimonas sp. TaxID=1871086 RepID=UPI0039197514